MIVHTFALRWKPEATSADKARAQADILAFQGQVPGLLETCCGPNFSPRANGFEFGAAMKFTSREALAAYDASPLHQQLLAWLVPLLADAQDVDFEA